MRRPGNRADHRRTTGPSPRWDHLPSGRETAHAVTNEPGKYHDSGQSEYRSSNTVGFYREPAASLGSASRSIGHTTTSTPLEKCRIGDP